MVLHTTGPGARLGFGAGPSARVLPAATERQGRAADGPGRKN